jgi:hypothetical protein
VNTGAARQQRQAPGKRFFFEKKKQKTFDLKRLRELKARAHGPPAEPLGKVFCFFSSEKKAFLATLPYRLVS